MTDNLLTIKEVADQLKTTKSIINYAIKKNDIEKVQKDNKFYIRVSDIDVISRSIKAKDTEKETPGDYNTELLKDVIKAKESEINTLKDVVKTLEKETNRLTAEMEFKNNEIAELNLTIRDLREIIKAKETKRNWLTIFKRS